MFEEFMMDKNPNICGNDLQIAKDNHYAEWVKNYVSYWYNLIININLSLT